MRLVLKIYHSTSKAHPTAVHPRTHTVSTGFDGCSMRHFVALLVVQKHAIWLYINDPSTRSLAIFRSINFLSC